MIKELLKPFAIVFGILGVPFLLILLNIDNMRNWLSPNRVFIQTYHDIDPKEIKLKWTVEGSQDTLIVFSDRRMTTSEFKAKGANHFFIFYKNQFIDGFSHFKQESWHGHDYYLEFRRTEKHRVVIDLEISGPDAHH